jgi:hypothetical protein
MPECKRIQVLLSGDWAFKLLDYLGYQNNSQLGKREAVVSKDSRILDSSVLSIGKNMNSSVDGTPESTAAFVQDVSLNHCCGNIRVSVPVRAVFLVFGMVIITIKALFGVILCLISLISVSW